MCRCVCTVQYAWDCVCCALCVCVVCVRWSGVGLFVCVLCFVLSCALCVCAAVCVCAVCFVLQYVVVRRKKKTRERDGRPIFFFIIIFVFGKASLSNRVPRNAVGGWLQGQARRWEYAQSHVGFPLIFACLHFFFLYMEFFQSATFFTRPCSDG